MRYTLIACFFALAVSMAAAQDTCPLLVESALLQIDEQCSEIFRNQICYGHSSIHISPQADVDIAKFDAPGDVALIEHIQSLQLSPMNEDMSEWGISSMKIQANLPDTAPGQSVTFVMFGGVSITNTSDAISKLDVKILSTQPVNVRSGPATTYSAITSLEPDVNLIADGRNANADWIRVQLSDDAGYGWVASFLLEANEEFQKLPIVDTNAPTYKPMQAILLQTGIGDARCNEAPQSGILIQTPMGTGKIDLLINEVNITIGSTIFVQATPDNELIIYVLDGEIQAAALNKIVTVPEGAFTTIAMDDNLIATDAPSNPDDYDLDDLNALPMHLLPESVVIADPAPRQVILQAVRENLCQVTSSGTANFRDGPGTAYNIQASLNEGQAQTVTSQATGLDGTKWWLTIAGYWVKASVVELNGNCNDLQVIEEEEFPLLPDSSDQSTGTITNADTTVDKIESSTNYLHIYTCEELGGMIIRANDPVVIAVAVGTYNTPEDVETIKPTVSAWASFNGGSGTFIRLGGVDSFPGGYGFHVYFQFDAFEPGSYQVSGGSTHPGGVPNVNGDAGPAESTVVCTVTLQ